MNAQLDIRQLMLPWSKRLGGTSIVVGSMVLLGWLLDIPTLKSLHPDLVTMKANTALCFLAGGASLWLWHDRGNDPRKQRAAWWCAQVLVLVGGLTLAEYLLGRDFGIDQMLFREAEGAVATSSPGRMAPNTALSFVLLGLALAELARSRQEVRPPQYSQGLALMALMIALFALFGYAYGVQTLYGFASYTRMAVHTMGAFLLLASGVLIACPGQGLIAAVTAPGSGGQSARRLLPAALAIPAIAGWLFLEGERRGNYDQVFALTLVVVSNVLVFSVLIWWNSRSVEQIDRERRQTEERFRSAVESAPHGISIVDRNGKIVLVNARTEQMFGYSRAELLGQGIDILVPERFRAKHSSYLTSYFHNPSMRPIGTGRDLFGRCRDGREFPVDIGLSPIRSEEDDFVLATIIDISTRKETEEALRQARDELEIRVEERTNDLVKANDAAQAEIVERKRVEEQLTQLMAEVQKTVEILAAATNDILASTSQVASSSAETATAVSQTMATVEEVKQTSQLAAEKAKQVSESAQRTVEISKSGRKSVDESVESMHRIQEQMESIAESIVHLSEQGQAIGEIIATVNNLAEQSNLLAVNAAIEAAKAGDQGKGFAVVAQEVKSLAEQSKQATAQVRAILGDIQKATSGAVMATEQGNKAVEAGVKLSAEVGESIRVLAESIAEAARAATQIAVSAQQQLVGMDQAVLAIQNIREASSQNVASTRQTEGAAQNLHELGVKLKQLVARYRA